MLMVDGDDLEYLILWSMSMVGGAGVGGRKEEKALVISKVISRN